MSEDGFVRSTSVRMASRLSDPEGRKKRDSRMLERPAQELVVLPAEVEVVGGDKEVAK